MKKKGEIEEAIRNIRYDLKAEVILADLMTNGLESDDFVVIPNGTFKRRYSRDIAYTNPLKLQNGQETGRNLYQPRWHLRYIARRFFS